MYLVMCDTWMLIAALCQSRASPCCGVRLECLSLNIVVFGCAPGGAHSAVGRSMVWISRGEDTPKIYYRVA